jgi:Ca2+-binding RTX toxin-like protein
VSAALYDSSVNNGEAAGDNYVGIEGLVGGNYADYLYGDASFNYIEGLAGNDWIDGLGGADYLAGGAGNDTVIGGGGSDQLFGGSGIDYLSGGAGADYFVFSGDTQAGQSDTIGDFEAGIDYIGLPASVRGSVTVVDTAYGVDILTYISGGWHQIFVSNTHNVAQVTASIYYADL